MTFNDCCLLIHGSCFACLVRAMSVFWAWVMSGYLLLEAFFTASPQGTAQLPCGAVQVVP